MPKLDEAMAPARMACLPPASGRRVLPAHPLAGRA